MGKPVIDHARPRTGQRLTRFTQAERANSGTPGPQAKKLRRAPKDLDNAKRIRRYMKIDRQGI